ncbi:hypothetical protein [Streptomyces herbicida]|uniref:hypothetical protein n=1 Tax=Streptomyces herbicida TaxID=3065675 RepID=UPI00292E60BD|nr:hypothetical protein [Streptomyces sp. NEAU-HV9]
MAPAASSASDVAVTLAVAVPVVPAVAVAAVTVVVTPTLVVDEPAPRHHSTMPPGPPDQVSAGRLNVQPAQQGASPTTAG